MKERKAAQIYVRVPSSLKDMLKAKAKECNVKPAEIVRRAVEKFFQNPATVDDINALRSEFEEFRRWAAKETVRMFAIGAFWGAFAPSLDIKGPIPMTVEGWVEAIAKKLKKNPEEVRQTLWEGYKSFESLALDIWKKRYGV